MVSNLFIPFAQNRRSDPFLYPANNLTSSLCYEAFPALERRVCKYSGVEDVIKHSLQNDLASLMICSQLPRGLFISHALFIWIVWPIMHSLSINETMLIIFPLLITQPHKKTKSICVTGCCLGQGNRAKYCWAPCFPSVFKIQSPFCLEQKQKSKWSIWFLNKAILFR